MKKLLALSVILLLLGGCSGIKMKPANNQTLQPVSADTARMVFLRQAFLGKAISSSVYDVTGGEIRFIGIVNNDTRIGYDVAPGQHHFMVVGESADFLSADMAAGKAYYAVVSPRMGVWKARFSLRPVRRDGVGTGEFSHGSDAFKKWRTTTTLVENTSETLAWYEQNKASVAEKYNKYWPEWQTKGQASRDAQHMDPEDGL